MSALRILIADPLQQFRDRLRSLLQSRPEFTICGEAQDGKAAVESARELQPGLILLEYTLPILNGIEAAEFIRQSNPNVMILLISFHYSAELLSQAKTIGVNGHIAKTDVAEKLLQAIDRVLQGGTYFPSEE